jgi:glycoprotein endo-alpha-1,2-mannosidase
MSKQQRQNRTNGGLGLGLIDADDDWGACNHDNDEGIFVSAFASDFYTTPAVSEDVLEAVVAIAEDDAKNSPAPSWEPTEHTTSRDGDGDDEGPSRSAPGIPCCFMTEQRLVVALSSLGLTLIMAFCIGLVVGGLQGRKPFELLRPKPHWPADILVKPSNLTVGVYYYPWYYDDFHRHRSYLRQELDPPQRPVLGEYNDHDPVVIAQHLAWSRQANVKLWVTSWWGPRLREDTATLNILQNPYLKDNMVALFYETSGRILKDDAIVTDNIAPDMEYMCQNYFSDPHYFTIDGRPVLFVYLTRKLYQLGVLNEVINLMRATAATKGFNVYIIGDQVFGDAPFSSKGKYSPFDDLDGVTGYDLYGGTLKNRDGFYAGSVKDYAQESRDWKKLADRQSCTFIPAVTPGYNDRAKPDPSDQHAPLSRRLNASAEEGSLFRALLEEARYLVDEKSSNLLMVNSFNEWHEDTSIEPIVGVSTTLPFSVTQGVVYEGYGDLYLDILRNMTEDDDVNATKVVSNSTTAGNLNATAGALNSTSGGVNASDFALNVNTTAINVFAISTIDDLNTTDILNSTFGVVNASDFVLNMNITSLFMPPTTGGLNATNGG